MPTSSRECVDISYWMKHAALVVVAAGVSLLYGETQAQPVPSVQAQVRAGPGVAAAAAVAVKETPYKIVPLANLSNRVGPIRLTRPDGSASLSIPVARRETVKAASLHLVLTNSIALNERSQLVVRVNNRTVAQLQLSSRQPEVTADIHIPLELLQSGYNQLSFSVAQHSQDAQCEDQNAPELWVEIDTTASLLRVQTETKPLLPPALQLSALDDVFDPKQQALQKVNIVTAGHPDSDAALRIGGMLAQGVALKMRYLMPVINQVDAQAASDNGGGSSVVPGLALTELAGADNLLVGTVDALKPYLDPKVLQQVKGSFLGVYAMPDGQHVMLVIAGRDDQEVLHAAEVFAWQRLQFPAQNQWNISAFSMPQIPAYLPQANIVGQGRYSFKQLGFSTSAVSVGVPAEININLPPDVYAQEDAQMEFHLNFSQGAKINSDTMVNLYLNDVFQRAIVIDERQGGYYNNYLLSLPLSNFRPGTNVLSFRPMSVAQHLCAPPAATLMSLFDTSSVKVPYIYHFAELPDLARFASNGFPYVSHSDGSQLSLQLVGRDSATIGAAWTLIGKLAQQQAIPLSAAQITFGAAAPQRHALVVGSTAMLPGDLLTDAPWKLDGDLIMTSASLQMATPSQEFGWFRQQFQSLTNTNEHDTGAAYLNTTVRGDARLTQQLLVMQFRSQKLGGSTTTVFTSANPAQLQEGMRQLVDASYWNNMAGDLTLLTLGKSAVATQRIGPTYEEGHIGRAEYLGYIASKYPWTLYCVVLIVLALLTLLCWRALRRHLQRRTDRDV